MKKQKSAYTEGGYVFVHGMGFVHRSPLQERQGQLRKFSTELGLVLFLFVLFRNLAFRVFSSFFMAPFFSVQLGDGRFVLKEWAVQLLYMISALFYYGVPFALYKRRMKFSTPSLVPLQKIRKVDGAVAAGLALSASVLFALLLGGFRAVLSVFDVSTGGLEVLSIGVSQWEVAALQFFYSCLLIPVLEEVFFRGMILQPLRQFGNAFALFSSSFLFAVIHGSVDKAMNAFLMGVLLGYFVIRTDNVKIGVLMHVCVNTFGWLAPIFIRRSGVFGETLTYVLQVGLLFVGILSFLQMSRMWAVNDRVFRHVDLLPLKSRFALLLASPLMVTVVLSLCIQMLLNLRWGL